LSDLITEAEDLALSGKIQESLSKYDEAIAEDPKNPLPYVGKASIQKATGMYNEAIAALGVAISILPEWKVAKEDQKRYDDFVAMLHVLRGEAYLYANQPENAIMDLDAADSVRDADAASLVVRANALAQKKEWDEAGNCLYRAEEWCFLHEDSMLTQVWLTKIHCAKEMGGIFVPPYAAVVYKNKNWRMPKGSVDELLNRAENLRTTGLLYDSLRYYDSALELPSDKRAHILFLRGTVLEQLKWYEDAFNTYSEVLAASPSESDEFQAQVRMANIMAQRSTISHGE